MGQNCFKKLPKLVKFNLSNFTLTCQMREKWIAHSLIWLTQKNYSKNENVGQTYLKKHLNYTILVKYCVMAISRNSNRFLMSIERIVKVIKIIKVYEIISIQL